ncbi:hypothetical protein Hte_007117 [Hypoxylon texense]
MSSLLHSKYHQSGVQEDLTDAIRNGQDAVEAIPVDHPDRAGILNVLGDSLRCSYKRSKSSEDFDAATAAFGAASSQENAAPIDRIRAYKDLGSLFVDCARWAEASQAFESAIGLLPQVSPRTLPRADQQYVLGGLSGLSSIAAATALQANRTAADALALVEASRCLIASFAMNARSDVSDLRRKSPSLCGEYEKYRDGISRHGSWRGPTATLEKSPEDKSLGRSLADLVEVEAKIRRIPGLERFQLPPESDELMRLADKGPIITFNISSIRCDAIIVTPQRIWVRNLPKLTYDDVHTRARSISTRTMSRRNVKVRVSKKRSSRKQLKKDLLWLWESAVLPVLEEPDVQQYRNVWWVTGGSVGLLPIHAAGDHSEGSLENTISRVVSSYTSTFKALKYAREKIRDESVDHRLMLVNVPNTPGYGSLNTHHEVEVLNEKFGGPVTLLNHPGRTDVLENLRDCTFAHFACHGTSNPQDPSEGGIMLVEDGEPVLLKISELDAVNIRHAEFAYLSACSTAELPAGKLVDEAIHLSNSFQMLGFRHVVGTMWGADDHAAGEIARMFYEGLFSKSDERREGELPVAQALHEAVKKFRGLPGNRENIAKWGPFVHIGI